MTVKNMGTIDAVGQVVGGIAALAAIFLKEKTNGGQDMSQEIKTAW